LSELKKGTNKFYLGEDEAQPLAEIHFTESDNGSLIVDHTYVSEELRGQGVGEKLVEQMVQFAREEQKKIIPQCTYAQKQFDRHEEFRDVLMKE
jgi:predicted GNAT family acetyltransferase